MATRYWMGAADAVAQETTIQITGYDASTTYIVTIGNIAVSVVGNADVNTTASDLQVALEASTHPYFSDITWTVSTDTVTGTGNSSGFPFTAASSVSGGSGTIGSATTSTTAESPHHWNHVDNWSANTVPVATDDVVISGSRPSIFFDLDQSAVAFDTLKILQSYTGLIGLNPERHQLTSTTTAVMEEYRDTHLAFQCDQVEIGAGGPGTGSGRINLDNQLAALSNCYVYQTAAATADTGQCAVEYNADDSNAKLHILDAPGGICSGVKMPTDNPTFDLVIFTPKSASSRYEGRALTGALMTKFRQTAGTAVISSGASGINTMEITGGTCTTIGDEYTISTLNLYGGTLKCNHANVSGSDVVITTANVWGTLELLTIGDTRTITTLNLKTGGTFKRMIDTTVTNFALEDRTGQLTYEAI